MKYILIPIWRVLFALYVLFIQIILAIFFILAILWNFNIPKGAKISDFYYPIDDGYKYNRYSKSGKYLEEYYKTPYHALIKKKIIL